MMSNDNNKRKTFLDSLPYKLAHTKRAAELVGRKYYKDNVKTQKDILELDEFLILSYLKLNPKASQSEISKKFLKGKAHIGKILCDMEKKGYIHRVVNIENNIMVKHSVIAELGEKMYDYTDSEFKTLTEQTLKVFSEEEIIQFSNLLDKYSKFMLDNFEIDF